MGCSDSFKPGKKPKEDQATSQYKAGDIIAFYRPEKKIYNGRGVVFHVADVVKTGRFKGTATVIEEPLDEVKGSDISWVANVKDKTWGTPNDVGKILRRARDSVGSFNYNLITNNCEHFVTFCRYGRKYSSQTDYYLPWKVFERIMEHFRPYNVNDENDNEQREEIYDNTVKRLIETEDSNELEEEKITRAFEIIQNMQNKRIKDEEDAAVIRRRKIKLEIEEPMFEININ